MRLVIENGVYYIVESPDKVTAKNSNFSVWYDSPKDHPHPFAYIDGELFIGDNSTIHHEIGGFGRNKSTMKFPGRMWVGKKILSFWEYPNISQMKKLISDLENSWNNVECFSNGMPAKKQDDPDRYIKTNKDRYHITLKIDGSWKLDIPLRKTNSNNDTYSDFHKKSGNKQLKAGDWDAEGYLYSLKTVFSNKPLKGEGEKLRSGVKVNTDTGQEHVKAAILKGKAIQKMSPEQKKQLYDYFKNKGRLDYQEKKMWDMLQKRYESIEIYTNGNRIIIKENPDAVVAGYGDYTYADSFYDIQTNRAGKSRAVAFWKDSDAVPFGMKDGKFWFGFRSGMHDDIMVDGLTGFDRREFKYSGRMWTSKKVISFWEYPPFGELKKILNQISVDWSKGQGTHSINFNDWKIDIPRSSELDKMDKVSGKDMLRGISKWDRDKVKSGYQNTRLYSVKNVLSGKPLKGAGKIWAQGEKIDTNKGQQHIDSPIVKQDAIKRMSKDEKEKLYNYFKSKGRLNPAEKRFYDVLKSKTKLESTEVILIGNKILCLEIESNSSAGRKYIDKAIHRMPLDGLAFNVIKDELMMAIDFGDGNLKEQSNKKRFTLEEGSGKLTQL